MTDFEKKFVRTALGNNREFLKEIVVRAAKAEGAPDAEFVYSVWNNEFIIKVVAKGSYDGICLDFISNYAHLVDRMGCGQRHVNALCRAFIQFVRDYAHDKATLLPEYEKLEGAYARNNWYDPSNEFLCSRMAEIKTHMRRYDGMTDLLDILIAD